MSKHNACDTVRVVRAIAQTKKHTHLFTFLPTFFENVRVYVRERQMKRSAANPPAALSVQSPLPLSSQLHRCTAFFFSVRSFVLCCSSVPRRDNKNFRYAMRATMAKLYVRLYTFGEEYRKRRNNREI